MHARRAHNHAYRERACHSLSIIGAHGHTCCCKATVPPPLDVVILPPVVVVVEVEVVSELCIIPSSIMASRDAICFCSARICAQASETEGARRGEGGHGGRRGGAWREGRVGRKWGREGETQACTYKTYHMCGQRERAPQHERGTQSQRASRARTRARGDITRPADEGHTAGTLIAQVGAASSTWER